MKSFIAIIITSLLTILLGNCRTMQGFGRDVQHVGSKIEHEAAKH